MKFFMKMLAVFIGMILALIVATQANAQSVQDSYTTGDDSQQRVGNANVTQESQSFTASANYTLTSISLKMYKAASASGTLTVELYNADANHEATGTVLASGTITDSDITDTSAPGSFESITMSSYELTETNEYVIVARANTTAPDDFWWRYDQQNNFDGQGSQSIDSGASWDPINYDFLFEVYGTVGSVFSFEYPMWTLALAATCTFVTDGATTTASCDDPAEIANPTQDYWNGLVLLFLIMFATLSR